MYCIVQWFDEGNIDRQHLRPPVSLETIERENFDGLLAYHRIFPIKKLGYCVCFIRIFWCSVSKVYNDTSKNELTCWH